MNKSDLGNYSKDYLIEKVFQLESEIQDLKKEQRKLRLSEKRFRLLFEQAPMSMQIMKPNSELVQVNQAWERMWGVPFEKVKAPDFALLNDKEAVRLGLMPLIKRAFEKGDVVRLPLMRYNPQKAYYTPHQKDERERWLRAILYPIHNEKGELVEAIMIHDDVTDLKRTEEALRESESKFRSLSDANIIGVVISDLNGKVIESNQAFLDVIGCSQDDIYEGNLNWLELTHDIDKPIDKDILQLLNKQENCPTHEKRIHTKNGKIKYVLVGCALLIQNKDLVISYVLDITERKQHEALLKEAHEELTRLSQVRSEFITMVSHELRTPLSVIREGINLILDEVDGPVNDEQKETLNLTQTNVDRLDRLVHLVMNFTKIQAGKLQLELKESDFRALCYEVYDFMALAANKKNIQFDIMLPEEEIVAVFDEDKVKQILINLLDNAIKFTPEHGRVCFELKNETDSVTFFIKDSGKGLSEDSAKDVSALLSQGEGEFAQREGGGRGLVVAKKLTDLHKGKLQLVSTSPQGTTFSITLPKSL